MVQIMARRRIGDKPVSEPMLTHFTDAYMRYQGKMSLRSNLPLTDEIHAEISGNAESDSK